MGALSSKKKESSFEGEEVSFDHFQVLRAIGKGSFGKVCIVQKRDSKQMFAMKYMNKTQCEARDALSNVFREIEILASLSHPFLVNLWFSFQDEEDMFMVVDLLLGGDLRYHVQQGVQYTDEAVRLYILEVAAALQYLHKRSIIHRDIKPDNLLLDEEGHVHLTDFNIATVLRDDQLATSMSGTKPYMAPEVFECAADTCDGYSFPVDWWSLGVTAYEVRRGKRPYDIHSNTSLHEIRLMFLQNLKFPVDCHPGLVHLISRLLTISPEKRISSIDEILALPYTSGVCVDTLLKKKYKPPFTPPKDHLNCDPTFELEEMIIESRPLHKKKKRLSKQKSIRETHTSLSGTTEGEAVVYEGMLVFNREVEEARREREKRELEWQAELEESMKKSDPTGHGCGFTGSTTGTPVRHKSQEQGQEGKKTGEGNTPPSPTVSSPTERTQLPKIAVSPSNVRARIAGSPKVKVRGSTVTIESPRSSSSLTKSSTQQLKERLKELKADQRRHGGSGSDSDFSDLTQSDDLTITGRRSPGKSAGKALRASKRDSESRSPSKSPSRTPILSRKKAERDSSKGQEEDGGSKNLLGCEGGVKEGARAATCARPVSLPDEISHELQISTTSASAPTSTFHTTSGSQADQTRGSLARQPSDASRDHGSAPQKPSLPPSSGKETESQPPLAEPLADAKGNLREALTNGSVKAGQVPSAQLDSKSDCERIQVPAGQGRRHSMEPKKSPTPHGKRSAETRRSSSVTCRHDRDARKISEMRKAASVSKGSVGKETREALKNISY
ncbi:uncharacterized protein [Penaeus vannamei]|uniref:uncharacterized protein n=1 Tax=Penaeus vannamei TaxID=6689 RepID=UPI00387FAD61